MSYKLDIQSPDLVNQNMNEIKLGLAGLNKQNNRSIKTCIELY